MSKSQVRAGRLLLWQMNHFNIDRRDCDGTALVLAFRSFLVVLSQIVVVNNVSTEVQRKGLRLQSTLLVSPNTLCFTALEFP